MAETNSPNPSDAQADDKPVTEDDIKALNLKDAGVEPEKADEPAENAEEGEESDKETEGKGDEQIEGQAEEAESQDEATFTKKFPNIKGDTPEEYAQNLEAAYENSTAEALRLKKQSPPPAESKTQEEAEATLPSSLVDLYVERQMNKEMTEAWTKFSEKYSEVNDSVQYDKFVKRVATVNQAIIADEKRYAEPGELYGIAAASLGWQSESSPSDSEKLGMAIKDSSQATKTNSATKPKSASKVTDEMVAFNRKFSPGKSDAEIRKELEPHVQ